jgi:hypothetical protein
MKEITKNYAYFDKDCWKALVDRLQTQNFALHLIIEIVSKINPLDENCKLENIRINLSDLCDFIGLKGQNRLSTLKQAIKKIYGTVIDFETEAEWKALPFLNPYKSKLTRNEAVFTISEEFRPYLVDLEYFLKLKRNVLSLSNRALVFYATLKSIHKDTIFKIDYEDLKSRCNITYDYKNFKRKYLTPVLKELQNQNIRITYKEITGYRNKVWGLSFKIEDSGKDLLIPEASHSLVDIPQSLEQSVTESNQLTIDPPAKPAKKEPFEDEIREIFDYYVMVFNRAKHYKFDKDKANAIRARLNEGHSVEMLKMHIDYIANSPHHRGQNDNNTPYIDLIEHVCKKKKFDARMPKFEALEANRTSSPASNQALKKHNIANNMPEDTPIDHYLTEYTKRHPFLNRGLNEEEFLIVGQKWKTITTGRYWDTWCSEARKMNVETTFKIPETTADMNKFKDKWGYVLEKEKK